MFVLLNSATVATSVTQRREEGEETEIQGELLNLFLLQEKEKAIALCFYTKESLRKHGSHRKAPCESWDSRVCSSSSILADCTLAAGAHLTDKKIKDPYSHNTSLKDL